MHWVMVFDLDQVGFKNWYFCLFGLIPLTFGLLNPSFQPWRRVMAALFAAFGAVFMAATFVWSLWSYLDARSALHDGRVGIVEGTVANFHPGTQRRTETFDVGTMRFEYADDDLWPGFKTTQPRGGPVQAGEYVRIAYYNGEILRLEIRK